MPENKFLFDYWKYNNNYFTHIWTLTDTTPIETHQSVNVSWKYNDWSPFVDDVKRDHFNAILGLFTLASS